MDESDIFKTSTQKLPRVHRCEINKINFVHFADPVIRHKIHIKEFTHPLINSYFRKNFKNMLNNMSPKDAVLEKIKEKGGWVNTHAHLDRAYSLTKDTFSFTNSYLKEKWHLVDDMKRNSSVDDIYARMERAINHFLE
ncbi:MAG TPA: hypothetical protein VKY36_02790, partial [Moheibacter sp.]|nr:hypothetical protein [Moheibacter sp.]